MNPNISVFCLSLFFLLHFVGAKSVSDLQSLKQLLEEEINTAPYYSSEEMEVEGRDGNTDKSVFGAPEQHPWDSSDPSNSALQAAKDTRGSVPSADWDAEDEGVDDSGTSVTISSSRAPLTVPHL
ncbi:hypothetical protein PFLUV_G00051960 [Perca fluviatilis]|uniref:Uncharacterized protein n=1 Tax=Perca fluviatilis TaxID=8168 RepID=A0A6A5F515_PERFL|nr:hypothetical protein PFLUV_G00051960 [Perca fluviatilis]